MHHDPKSQHIAHSYYRSCIKEPVKLKLRAAQSATGRTGQLIQNYQQRIKESKFGVKTRGLRSLLNRGNQTVDFSSDPTLSERNADLASVRNTTEMKHKRVKASTMAGTARVSARARLNSTISATHSTK